MAEASDSAEESDAFVYSVRPEPPHFEELVRRPDPVQPYDIYPPGPVGRWVRAHRARFGFRVLLVVALGAVLVALIR